MPANSQQVLKRCRDSGHNEVSNLQPEMTVNRLVKVDGRRRPTFRTFFLMRSLRREDSPILDGYQIFHNFIRPHMALMDNKTPADVAGIEVRGANKWLTLIQNARLEKKQTLT